MTTPLAGQRPGLDEFNEIDEQIAELLNENGNLQSRHEQNDIRLKALYRRKEALLSGMLQETKSSMGALGKITMHHHRLRSMSPRPLHRRPAASGFGQTAPPTSDEQRNDSPAAQAVVYHPSGFTSPIEGPTRIHKHTPSETGASLKVKTPGSANPTNDPPSKRKRGRLVQAGKLKRRVQSNTSVNSASPSPPSLIASPSDSIFGLYSTDNLTTASGPVSNIEPRRSHRQSGIPALVDDSLPPDVELNWDDPRLPPHVAFKPYGRFRTVMVDAKGDGHDLHCPVCLGNRKPGDGELLAGWRGIKAHIQQAHPDRSEYVKGKGEVELVNLFRRGLIRRQDLLRLKAREDDEEDEGKVKAESAGQQDGNGEWIWFDERDVAVLGQDGTKGGRAVSKGGRVVE